MHNRAISDIDCYMIRIAIKYQITWSQLIVGNCRTIVHLRHRMMWKTYACYSAIYLHRKSRAVYRTTDRKIGTAIYIVALSYPA